MVPEKRLVVEGLQLHVELAQMHPDLLHQLRRNLALRHQRTLDPLQQADRKPKRVSAPPPPHKHTQNDKNASKPPKGGRKAGLDADSITHCPFSPRVEKMGWSYLLDWSLRLYFPPHSGMA